MRRKFYRKHVKRINPALLAILFLEFVFSPHIALADQQLTPRQEAPMITADSDPEADNNAKIFNPEIKFPQAADRKIVRTFRVTATAYSSTRAQTDSTPFISASGGKNQISVAPLIFQRFFVILKQWPRGGVVTQRSAKPRTPVQFRPWPP